MQTMGFIQSNSNTNTSSSILVPQTFTHSIAFGQTGSGKTTGYIYPNLQERVQKGHGVLLYDYKGNEHLSVKYFAAQAGRLDDVIEIGKPWGEYINLIENMGEEEFDRFFDNVLHHSDDNKFWQNSAKALGQTILKILREISNFSNEIQKIEGNSTEAHIKAGKFYYPTKYTLASLVKVCQTFEKLGGFINNLTDLLFRTNQMIQESLQRAIKNHKDIDALKPQYASLIRARERLVKVIKETSDSLEGLGKDSNENLTQNIIGSLISPLFSLSQNQFFNTNNFDIAKALSLGKIIVINTVSLSDEAIESFNNIILDELTKRTHNITNNPISIFIDEAQRILSDNTDLPIDVLREAKVDIFLAVQNSALLKKKLSEENFDALIGNLTSQFYFQNGDAEDIDSEHELKNLNSFEYLTNANGFIKLQHSQPLHVSLKEKIEIEYLFQKRHKVLDNFSYQKRKESIILKYDPRMYKNDELHAVDINTLAQSTVDVESEKSLNHIASELKHLFELAIEEVNSDINHEYEYEYFDEEELFEEAS